MSQTLKDFSDEKYFLLGLKKNMLKPQGRKFHINKKDDTLTKKPSQVNKDYLGLQPSQLFNAFKRESTEEKFQNCFLSYRYFPIVCKISLVENLQDYF